MTEAIQSRVATLGLFEQRFSGDDCLMQLTSRRFREAMMGAEMHGGSTDDLERRLSFRPSGEAAVIFHLPRDFKITDQATRERVVELARHFAGRVSGFVVHDHNALVKQPAVYLDAASQLNWKLANIQQCPTLFIEYAVGVPPGEFARFFESGLEFARIGPCIDIGHVGIRAARNAFAARHPGEDVCALKSQPPSLTQLMPDVDAAVAKGVEVVLDLIGELLRLNGPIHFHLHDGHPLSASSPFGLADHLSFFAEIPLSFEHRGRRALATMFGPEGLSRIVSLSLRPPHSTPVSFTLEIHPTGERLPLGEAAPLFSHWTDKTNAEKMNHWLSILTDNHWLLTKSIRQCAASGAD